MRRTQKHLRRVLTLIDALSVKRLPFTVQDAIHFLEEKSGSRAKVCERTIQRDLELLVSLNLAHVHRKGVKGSRGAGRSPTLYKMDLRMNNVQLAAKKAVTND